MLYGSFWIIGDFAFIYNAVYVERRNEIKDKVRIKLKCLLTEFTLIYISNFFYCLFIIFKKNDQIKSIRKKLNVNDPNPQIFFKTKILIQYEALKHHNLFLANF